MIRLPNLGLQHPDINYLNSFESLARGVNAGVYDEGIGKRARGSYVVRNWKRFEDYIKDYRARKGRQKAWREWERFAKRWQGDETEEV